MSSIQFEHQKIKISFALIAFATLIIGILIAIGLPISPWWLLAPILTPFALVVAGAGLLIVSALVIISVLIAGGLIAIALVIISAVPILLTYVALKLLTFSL